MDEDELLNIREAAAFLRISETTLRRRLAMGEIPAAKVGAAENSRIRISKRALRRYLWGDEVAEL